MESAETAKRRAATASLLFNLGSTLLKIIAAVLTGSVSLLSEAIHSATDVASSTIALIGVKAAAVPPDEEHPYGHGKIESLAGFGESILLFLVVIYVIAEAIHRLIVGHAVQSIDLAIGVMLASTVGSLIVSRYVFGVAKATGSLALKSNGQHLLADFWTSVGVLVALALTRFAGWRQADAVIAILLSFWIAYSAWKLAKEAFDQLIDVRLSPEDLKKIDALLKDEGKHISHHRLRTRRSGMMRYIDMHIVVPQDWSVVEAHEVADLLEKRIEAELAPAQVVIHVDPFDVVKAKP